MNLPGSDGTNSSDSDCSTQDDIDDNKKDNCGDSNEREYCGDSNEREFANNKKRTRKGTPHPQQ